MKAASYNYSMGRYFWPVIASSISSLVLVLLFTIYAVRAQDSLQFQFENRLANRLVSGLTSELAAVTWDNASWDEAARNLILEPSRTWAEQTFKAAAYGNNGIDGWLVLDGTGREMFSEFSIGAPLDNPQWITGIARVVAAAAAAPTNSEETAEGLIYVERRVFAIAASIVGPVSAENFPDISGLERPAVAAIIEITASDWRTLGDEFNLLNLNFVPTNRTAANGELPLTDVSGRRIGSLVWNRTRPGYEFLQTMLLPLGAGMALTIGLVWMYSRRLIRLLEDLNKRSSLLSRQQESLREAVGLSQKDDADLQQTQSRVLDVARANLAVKAVSYWCFDEAENLFLPEATVVDSDQPHWGEYFALPASPTEALFRQLAAKQVLRISGQDIPGLFADHFSSPSASEEPMSGLLASVQRGDKLLGVMVFVDEPARAPWSDLEVSFTQSMANVLALHLSMNEIAQTFAELERTRDDAEEANLAKSLFLSRMSHELRTPLNAVIGFSQLLELDAERLLTDEAPGHVEIILHAGQHLLNLIDEVLDISRIEARVVNLDIAELDLGPVIKECVELTGQAALERGISIVNLTEPVTVLVQSDARRLRQILLNLLSNAAKYNRENGQITIEVREPDNGFVEVSVADTGIGIATADRDKVFEPFSRFGELQGEVEGNGIGLVLTQQLVELLGGRISFTSTPGEGTTFTFTVVKSAEAGE